MSCWCQGGVACPGTGSGWPIPYGPNLCANDGDGGLHRLVGRQEAAARPRQPREARLQLQRLQLHSCRQRGGAAGGRGRAVDGTRIRGPQHKRLVVCRGGRGGIGGWRVRVGGKGWGDRGWWWGGGGGPGVGGGERTMAAHGGCAACQASDAATSGELPLTRLPSCLGDGSLAPTHAGERAHLHPAAAPCIGPLRASSPPPAARPGRGATPGTQRRRRPRRAGPTPRACAAEGAGAAGRRTARSTQSRWSA